MPKADLQASSRFKTFPERGSAQTIRDDSSLAIFVCKGAVYDKFRQRSGRSRPIVGALDNPLDRLVPEQLQHPHRALRVREDVAALVSRIPRDLLDEFVEAVRERFGDPHVDHDLWGPLPSTEEVQQAAAWRLTSRLRHRDAAARGAVPMRLLAQIWRRSAGDIADEARSGVLVAIRQRDDWYFPRWQFDEKWLPLTGVSELLRVFPGGATALSLWITAPNLELHNHTPAEYLKRGEWQVVVKLARERAVAGS